LSAAGHAARSANACEDVLCARRAQSGSASGLFCGAASAPADPLYEGVEHALTCASYPERHLVAMPQTTLPGRTLVPAHSLRVLVACAITAAEPG
jgi:hypothetical protein